MNLYGKSKLILWVFNSIVTYCTYSSSEAIELSFSVISIYIKDEIRLRFTRKNEDVSFESNAYTIMSFI